MDFQTTLYNAFTGISPAEKSAVVRFLYEHNSNASKKDIQEAVEYAVKHKPSFGGFIFMAHVDRKIIAVIVANKTGMEGYNPKIIFIYVTLHKSHRRRQKVVRELLKKAIRYADGDIALHVEPNNPALKLYQRLGFQSNLLELRLIKSSPAIA